ncbi:hypothetical protein TNCV_1987241 [Trichonephila clavipes]|nr:hypothetical protein TNCV_1987241 [Trichonephila clavipes]
MPIPGVEDTVFIIVGGKGPHHLLKGMGSFLNEVSPFGLWSTTDEVMSEATRGHLATDLVILNHGQVTKTTPELAPHSPNYHTTPTGGRLSS